MAKRSSSPRYEEAAPPQPTVKLPSIANLLAEIHSARESIDTEQKSAPPRPRLWSRTHSHHGGNIEYVDDGASSNSRAPSRYSQADNDGFHRSAESSQYLSRSYEPPSYESDERYATVDSSSPHRPEYRRDPHSIPSEGTTVFAQQECDRLLDILEHIRLANEARGLLTPQDSTIPFRRLHEHGDPAAVYSFIEKELQVISEREGPETAQRVAHLHRLDSPVYSDFRPAELVGRQAFYPSSSPRASASSSSYNDPRSAPPRASLSPIGTSMSSVAGPMPPDTLLSRQRSSSTTVVPSSSAREQAALQRGGIRTALSADHRGYYTRPSPYGTDRYTVDYPGSLATRPAPLVGAAPKSRSKAKRLVAKRPGEAPECAVCGLTKTSEWRKGPTGPRTLCNACGLLWGKLLKTSKSTNTDGTEAPSPTLEDLKEAVEKTSKNQRSRADKTSPVGRPSPNVVDRYYGGSGSGRGSAGRGLSMASMEESGPSYRPMTPSPPRQHWHSPHPPSSPGFTSPLPVPQSAPSHSLMTTGVPGMGLGMPSTGNTRHRPYSPPALARLRSDTMPSISTRPSGPGSSYLTSTSSTAGLADIRSPPSHAYSHSHSSSLPQPHWSSNRALPPLSAPAPEERETYGHDARPSHSDAAAMSPSPSPPAFHRRERDAEARDETDGDYREDYEMGDEEEEEQQQR